jgi:hypothetical protein
VLPVLRPPLFLPPLLLRPPPFRPERLLDLRDDDLRAPPLRPEDDFLPPRDDFLPPDDLRAPPERLLDRFRPPPLRLPLLRPEDPDRDRFLPPPRLLDFLAAAIRKLRVGGFVEPIARFEHNADATCYQTLSEEWLSNIYRRRSVAPCCIIRRSSGGRPAAVQTSRMRSGGSFIGSSVSLNVPQCEATMTRRRPCCAASS